MSTNIELTAVREDYLEAILVLSLRNKVVRVKDIAKFLNVSYPSVVLAMRVLEKQNLISHEKYGYIELTKKGKAASKIIYERHKLLSKFFNELLGIDLKTAMIDACKIEHYLNKKTIDRITKFIEFLEKKPMSKYRWLKDFCRFAKSSDE